MVRVYKGKLANPSKLNDRIHQKLNSCRAHLHINQLKLLEVVWHRTFEQRLHFFNREGI